MKVKQINFLQCNGLLSWVWFFLSSETPPPWFGQIPNFIRFSLTVIRWGRGGGELLTNCLILLHRQLRLLGGTKNKLQKLGFLLTLTAFYWLIRFSTDFVLTFTSFFQLFIGFYCFLLTSTGFLLTSTAFYWHSLTSTGLLLICLLSTDLYGFLLTFTDYWPSTGHLEPFSLTTDTKISS